MKTVNNFAEITRSAELAFKIAALVGHWVKNQADECTSDEDGIMYVKGHLDLMALLGPVQRLLREKQD